MRKSNINRRALFGIIPLLLAVIMMCSLPGMASAEAEKALYLQAGLYSSVSDYTHGAELVEEIQKRVNTELKSEEYHDFIYNVSPESSFSLFLEAGEARGLVGVGTFLPDETDIREQYRFMTEVNGFMTREPTQYTLIRDAGSPLYTGDLLFWRDPEGEIVNAGLVCSVHGSYCLAAVDNPDTGTAMLCLSNDTVGYSESSTGDLTDFIIVRPSYSSIEQQIYLYCRSEMGYTRAGACGILANIAFESGFHTGAQEPEPENEAGSETEAETELETEAETEPLTGIGICQWSYERREYLTEFCEENGLDRMSLEGQLAFMKYELEGRFAFTGDFLKTAPENETGAYDAGYWTCFEYEQPADFDIVSEDRAELSANSYWPLYKNAVM